MPEGPLSAHHEVLTPRLRLRAPQATDAPFVLELLSDPAATEHNPSDAAEDPAEVRARVLAWQDQWQHGLGYWVVVRREDDRPIGVCGVKAVDLGGTPVWNLLYRFRRDAWGRGYAREAAGEAVARAQQVDPRRPVIARVRPENTASAAVAAAIGLHRSPELDLVGDDGPDEVWSTRSTAQPCGGGRVEKQRP